MTKHSIVENPVFIPKILDKNFSKISSAFPAILMDANIVQFSPNVAAIAKASTGLFIIDPKTHVLAYRESAEKVNYQKLPWSAVDDLKKIYSDPTYRLEELVIKSLQYQNENQAQVIIAPYLFAEDINSINFSTNMTLVSESIRHVKSASINKPLFAMISINSHVLADTKMVNYIADRYGDDLKSDLRGYFIIINELDDRTADEEVLRGLAYLAFRLSQDKDVFIKHVGGFGEILTLMGASGFVSGLGSSEVFTTKNLHSATDTSRGRNHNEWTYVPELYDYINATELTSSKINYQCACRACNGEIRGLTVTAAKKLHFLIKRIEKMEFLASLENENKVKFMLEDLKKSAQLAKSYKTRFGSALRIEHMKRWVNVLESAQSWGQISNDNILNKLLADIKKNI